MKGIKDLQKAFETRKILTSHQINLLIDWDIQKLKRAVRLGYLKLIGNGYYEASDKLRMKKEVLNAKTK